VNVIYARVSTEEQAKTGYGIDSQLQACRAKFAEMGITIDKEYVDEGYSGEFIDRPEMDKLREDLYNGLIGEDDLIGVYDPDRVARNLTHMLLVADEVEKAGAKLTFVTGDYDVSPEGKMFFSIRGAIAAFEKAKIRERTTRGKRTKALGGKIVQNAYPYGFGWDNVKCLYTINEKEAEAVRAMFDLCIKEKLGAFRISEELTKLNFFNRKKEPFNASHIRNIFDNPMYCGEYHQFNLSCKQIGQRKIKTTKAPIENHVIITIPAIVSRETWEAVQQQRATNKSIAKRNTQHEYLLQGLLYCPLCGKKLSATVNHGKRKNSEDVKYYYYFCLSEKQAIYKGQRCGNKRISSDLTDDIIWNTLIKIASGEEDINNYIKGDTPKDYTEKIHKLTKQKNILEKKKEGIAQWFTDGLINRDTATKQLQSISKDILEINTTISDTAALQNKNKPAKISTDDILQAISFEQKRKIMCDFDYKIYVVKENDAIKFWFSR
jgi:site-specific DNA recombinase